MNIVSKENRALLVVVYLSTNKQQDLEILYSWFDRNLVRFAQLVLNDDYEYICILKKENAVVSSKNFISKIKEIAANPEIRALDVILSLHGVEGRLIFSDGRIYSQDLGQRLRAEGLKDKLRLLYSGACYGNSHAGDFIDAGFRVASGAIGVASNGAFDFPLQFIRWSSGEPYEAVVKAGNFQFGIDISDTVARMKGYKNVNSKKLITGDKRTRISSLAN
jgi:hypothetical protein